MSPPAHADPDLLESIILEPEVHKGAMPSGPFNPNPFPKPKKEESERILLTAELYPSASNGAVSVNVILAGVQRKAMQLAAGAANRALRSIFGAVGGGTIRVVSKSGVPVPGGDGSSAGVQFQEGCGSCGVKESEEGAGAVFEAVLGEIPWLLSGDSVRAAVSDERSVQEAVAEIMGILESAEEAQGGDSGYGGEEGKSDTVLITVCNCLEDDGTGYIDMVPLAADEGRGEEQDHEVCHAGGRF